MWARWILGRAVGVESWRGIREGTGLRGLGKEGD